MAFVKNVGKFFGVASTDDSDTLKEWQSKVEGQLKRGDFGISLQRSFSTTHRVNSAKLLSKARRVLSLVEAVQREDEAAQTDEDEEEKDVDKATTKEDKTVSNSSSKVARLSLEFTANQLFYTDELDFSSDSSISISQTAHGQGDSSSFLQDMPQVKLSHDENMSVAEEQSEKLQNKASETDLDNIEVVSLDAKDVSEITDTKELNKDRTNVRNRKDIGTKVTDEVNQIEQRGKEDENNVINKMSCDMEHISEAKDETEVKSETLINADTQPKLKAREEELEDGENTQSLKRSDTESLESEEPVDKVNKKESMLGPEAFVYGKDAFIHYKFYTQIEKQMEKRDVVRRLKEKISEYDWKIRAVDDLVTLAKDYYMNPESQKAGQWRALKRRVKRSSSRKLGGSANRRKLDSVTEYKPYFTSFIILAQLIAMTLVCALGGITDIGVEPQLSLEEDVQTFFGMETVHKWTPPNIWIGPDQQYMIGVGGVYAPCMRDDIEIQLLYSKQNMSIQADLGCCEVQSRNTAGTTTQAECDLLTEGVGMWKAGATCGERSHEESSIRHVLKPCCVGSKGQCRLLSHKHCTFLNGHFHKNGPEHCSLISAIMEPYHCHVGAVGSVFGMVGVTLIELAQFWTIIESPMAELLKLLAAVTVFLLCGTLPYLNIFGMLGGLVIGALTGIVLLPYITFSRWQTRVRLVLIILSVPVLLLIFILLSHAFRVVQTTENCNFCKFVNCVPYTDKMCDTELWQQ